MTEPSPIDMSMSQIIRCSYVQFGCVWMRQYQVGEREDAQERRKVHEEVCSFRFHRP